MIKYNVIYADPPWSYYNGKSVNPDVTVDKGFKRPPYPVLGTEDLKNLRVDKIANDSCALFMWVVDNTLEVSFEIAKAWGFEYSTVAFVWQKKNKEGKQICYLCPYTLKHGNEMCLLFKKGRPHKNLKCRNIWGHIESPRLEHSAKPDEVRTRIEKMFDGPRIELFARKKYDGWDALGNEIDGKDIRNILV